MTVDHGKLSQIVTLIAAALPDAVSLLERINTCPGTWYKAIDLANDFSLVPPNKEHQNLLARNCL